MTITTRVLQCQPSRISFTGDQPTVDSETLCALQDASSLLHGLQPVAFPTETVYGLGALALDSTAASRIFSTKGRPPDNPLIVHVSSREMLRRLLPQNYEPSPVYEVLMNQFWPGPLTLLFPTSKESVPPIITANHPTVAVRIPSHPVARALISIADAPIAAPSANTSGKPSPTRAEHVVKDLGGKIQLILDGGPCGVGLESTVIDGLHEDGNLRVLRPGGVTVEEIEGAIRVGMRGYLGPLPKVLVHRRDYADKVMEEAPSTPGMKYRHYSPAVPVILIRSISSPPRGNDPITLSAFLGRLRQRTKQVHGTLKAGLLMPSDSPLLKTLLSTINVHWHTYHLGPLTQPSVIAQRLFDGLLTLEEEGVDLILVEELREEREGLAVMNRVQKAAEESVWLDLNVTNHTSLLEPLSHHASVGAS